MRVTPVVIGSPMTRHAPRHLPGSQAENAGQSQKWVENYVALA